MSPARPSSSALTAATKQIATLPAKDKPAYGAALNEAKARIEAALETRTAALHGASLDQSLREREDLTLPGRPARIGRVHPVTATIREVSRVFATMGFETVEGPEIETDYYNFEALNIPPGHPAREKWDTLWVSNPLGDARDHHAAEGMTNEHDVIEVLPFDLVHHIVDLRRERDAVSRKMGALPNAGKRRRDHIVSVRSQSIGDASPAPSTMPRAVHKYERCALGLVVRGQTRRQSRGGPDGDGSSKKLTT